MSGGGAEKKLRIRKLNMPVGILLIGILYVSPYCIQSCIILEKYVFEFGMFF